MIIGNGLIGSSFMKFNSEFEDCVIFASGVSNSNCNDSNLYDKEIDLLYKTIKEYNNLKFIYFSSVFGGLSDTDYYNHKQKIEEIIKKECSNGYLIFKIPQVVGNGGNPNNLFNLLVNNIKHGYLITTSYGVKRCLLDVDDLVFIVKFCKNKVSNDILWLTNIELIDVFDLIDKISYKLGITPILNTIPNSEFNLDVCLLPNSEIIQEAILDNIDIINYNDKIIKKYVN